MMAALQQKEEELAALRKQVANTRNHTNDVNTSTSHNGPHPQPEITLEAIQRMISEGVKAIYANTLFHASRVCETISAGGGHGTIFEQLSPTAI